MPYPGSPPESWFSQRLKAVRETALDVLYPRACCECKIPLPHKPAHHPLSAWFCETCTDALPRVEAPYCSACGEPFDGAITTEFRCYNCEGRRLAFDFAVAGFRAEGAVRELIHRFKYHREMGLRGVLSDLLLGALNDPRLAEEDLSNWLLVPVPLHFWRERRRQFNQSWELCLSLSQATGIPAVKALRRTRLTQVQAHLDREQRLANMRGVFSLRHSLPWRKIPDLKGRRILLVDDVLTTGATSHACAKVLKRKGGAEKVVVITAARG
jgi:ComF family protein